MVCIKLIGAKLCIFLELTKFCVFGLICLRGFNNYVLSYVFS